VSGTVVCVVVVDVDELVDAADDVWDSPHPESMEMAATKIGPPRCIGNRRTVSVTSFGGATAAAAACLDPRCYPDSVYPKTTIADILPMAGTGKGRTPRQRAFGDRVRARRDELGLTQEALAHRAGLNRTYVATLESGERNPSLDTIVRVANGLGIDPGSLIEGLGRLAGRYDRNS
jgi:DNA-binding XRE family transcriptional regulator